MLGFGNFKTLAAAALFVAIAGESGAAPVYCDTLTPDVTFNVTPNSGCMALISPDNDSDAAVDGMFSVSGWIQIDKVDPPPTGGGTKTDGALTLTGDLQNGTWSIAGSVFAAWQNVMLVFKGGDKAVPDAVIAYLITGSPVTGASGGYSTPFFDLIKDKACEFECDDEYQPKDISHVSLYVAGPAPIPVPAAGFLLLGALGGLAALRRRKTA